jgi:Zn-dependent protease
VILTFKEIFDFILIWLATAFIFLPKEYYHARQDFLIKFFLLTGLSTVLHEFFHKISAIMLGVHAEFHAFYYGLMLGLLLKLLFPNFIFFIPGYVTIYSNDPLVNFITALAGPFANFLLFIIFKYFSLKKNDWLLYSLAQLNLWLFIFNMLPIPPLDGFKALISLIELF